MFRYVRCLKNDEQTTKNQGKINGYFCLGSQNVKPALPFTRFLLLAFHSISLYRLSVSYDPCDVIVRSCFMIFFVYLP